MPGVSRVTVDVAGGLIVGNLAPTVFVIQSLLQLKELLFQITEMVSITHQLWWEQILLRYTLIIY